MDASESNDWREWPVGAHLVSPRRGYLHHGLYAGGGRVIHYAGFNRAFRRGPVEEVALAQFTAGRSVQVLPRATPRFNGAAAVQRARARLGENRYRVWSNNCEHFVEWCVSGTSRSAQVDRWMGWLRSGLGALRAPRTLARASGRTLFAG
jgi:Lecithin retinol acyltransferase